MEATLRVYECKEEESKAGNAYYKVFGKIGSCAMTFISNISLSEGEQRVEIELSEYKGEAKLRIVGLAG